MISNTLAAALEKRGIHYGWVVAGTTFLVMLATAGAMGSAGVLIQPLEQEFGWTTAEISSALAVRLLFFGLLGPFAAAFMNRFGIRPRGHGGAAADRRRCPRLAVHARAVADAAAMGRGHRRRARE